MLEPLSENAQSKDLGLSHGLVRRRAICQDARQLWNLRKPSTVFAFALDCKFHRSLHNEFDFRYNNRKNPGIFGAAIKAC